MRSSSTEWIARNDVPWDDAMVVSAGKLRKLWDSLSELRSFLCERRLEKTVLRPAPLPVKSAQFTQFFRQVWRFTVKSLSLTECMGCFSQHMQFATVKVALFKTRLHISDVLLQASIKGGSLYPEVMEIINGKVKPTLLSSSSVFTLVFREQANNGPRVLNTEHAEPWADTIKTWHTYSMQGSACMRHPNHLMLASASCWLMVHVTTPLCTILLGKPASPVSTAASVKRRVHHRVLG